MQNMQTILDSKFHSDTPSCVSPHSSTLNVLRSLLSGTTAVLIASLLAVANPALAETPEEKGLAIAVESDKRNTGFTDTTADMKMILRNRAGKESLRRMRSMVLEVQGDGDKSLTIFDDPKDVKGTASLTFSHSVKPDEQWLYLPALKRVKRISSKNKSGPFMGSEFAFEDIASQEVDKYTYKFIGEDTFNGRDVFVVESYPAYKNSGYTRLVSMIDKEEYYPHRIEYYDRKGALLKILVQSDHQKYLDKYWRAGTMEMTNEQTAKSTTLSWDNYEFKTGLSKADFSSKALKRFR